ncbi:MAG: SDR family NAD(P)-dependent oxidoreductase [Nitrospinota bacterium]
MNLETGGKFAGQSAFVTGAATGIGESCARKLAAEGAFVAVCDLNEEGGRRVADAIQKAGGEAVISGADLTDWTQTRAAVEDFHRQRGRLDIAVHSAGGGPPIRQPSRLSGRGLGGGGRFESQVDVLSAQGRGAAHDRG